MNNLIGLKVKIALNATAGFITLVGKVVDVFDQFILIDSTIGPYYVSYSAIKTIQVIGEHHEKN